MPELSLVVITCDAGAQLAACLDSVRFAAETLVVDSGSRDDTVEIARARGARVIEQPWLGFGPQRRHAVAHAAHDWVLCLDADEMPRRSSRSPSAGPCVSRVMPRSRWRGATAFGRWLRHGEGYPDWTIRLFDRRHARWTDDVVHEHVVADGLVGRLDGDLLHASAESLDAYLAKQNRYSTLQAEAMHARGELLLGSADRLAARPLRAILSGARRFSRRRGRSGPYRYRLFHQLLQVRQAAGARAAGGPSMTTLVTGAAGFIGMHLALRLARDGADVVGVDNFDPYYDVALKRARADQLARAGVRCVELDLADHAATAALFRDGRYAHVAHLAAQPGVRYSLQNPAAYIRNNIGCVRRGH